MSCMCVFVCMSHWDCPLCVMQVMATGRRERHRELSLRDEISNEKSIPPCPGDTLPWNLSKHQRVKRSKSASAEVLDPAERAVIRIAGGPLRFFQHHNVWLNVLITRQKDFKQQCHF